VDTCFLIDLMNGDSGAVNAVAEYNQLKTRAISSAEFLYGAKKSSRKKAYDLSVKFLNFFPILAFDAESAIIYADIAESHSETGRHISTFDELIAAIALRHDEPLITRDRHLAEVERLELIAY
jgi:predicted nucleic acid-binding protein